MKKIFIFTASAALLASCANDEILDFGDSAKREVPIILSTHKNNVTRATNLETNLHYNFGVWAQKVKTGSAQTVMENYLVGWSNNTNKGYKVGTLTTTYATAAGTTADHTSPWFYEGLGTAEYTYDGSEGFYTKNQPAYMSAHVNQYLRYWDLAYTNTNFYCYSPYQKSGVTTTMNADGTATMSFDKATIRDGYDCPVNTAYAPTTGSLDRSLSEFMFGGCQATNASLADVTIPFQHMGAQLFVRFYEDVPGYKVELLDLNGDNGTMSSSATTDQVKGVQATPAEKPTTGTTYTKGSYYTTSGATVVFSSAAVGTMTPVFTESTTSQENLMFKTPSITATDYSSANIPTGYAANLVDFTGLNSTTHKSIQEAVTTGTQSYSWSPTIYYPVAQPTTQKTGFTFHVTYRIIAEDNKEVITVHNATVFVPDMSADTTPVSIARWESNKRYIYTFKITRNATGTTSPATTIDPTDPTPSTVKSLYPIVFDGCTIEDYTEASSDHVIN